MKLENPPQQRGASYTLGAIFRVPIAIALASAVGLGAALLGDGIWDAVSWVALASPVVTVAHAIRRSRLLE